MASRKKADVVPTVAPTIEQPSEQPVIANVAPATPVPSLNVAPDRLERPVAPRPSFSVREPSTGNKGGAKTGAGKAPNRDSGKKKNAKRKAIRLKGFGGEEKRPRKKTNRKGAEKRVPGK
jgi:hypothetical protein